MTPGQMTRMGYLVANIPRFELPNKECCWQWWNKVTILIKSIIGNSRRYDCKFWNGVTIWQREDHQRSIVWKVNRHVNDNVFGSSIESARSSMPWLGVQGIALRSIKDRVEPHQGGLPMDLFTVASRIMQIDECHDIIFYLVHQNPAGMFHPDLRQGPNFFLFQQQNFLHGAAAPAGGCKILARIDSPLADVAGFLEHPMEQAKNGAKYEAIACCSTTMQE